MSLIQKILVRTLAELQDARDRIRELEKQLMLAERELEMRRVAA